MDIQLKNEFGKSTRKETAPEAMGELRVKSPANDIEQLW
jgi:hypothetical protein